jgi:hypothetical protein
MASSGQAVPTIGLISRTAAVTQSAVPDYVGPYKSYVNDRLAKYYPAIRGKIIAPSSGQVPKGAWIVHFADNLNQPVDGSLLCCTRSVSAATRLTVERAGHAPAGPTKSPSQTLPRPTCRTPQHPTQPPGSSGK